MTTAREKEVRDAIEAFLNEHVSYQEQAEREDFYHLTERFSVAIDTLLGVWRGGGAANMPHQVIAALGGLEVAMYEFDTQDSPIPQADLWSAIERLREAMKTPEEAGWQSAKPGPHESIKVLHEQKLSHDQIARMWGLQDDWPNGRVRVDLVQKELDDPGSVITEGYEHPADAVSRKQYEEDLAHTASMLSQQRQTAAEQEVVECPESSYELWATGRFDGGTRIDIEQAAKMLGRTVDDVAAEWKSFDDDREADKTPKEPDDMKRIRSRAKELGIGFNSKTTAESLKSKIEEAEVKMEKVS